MFLDYFLLLIVEKRSFSKYFGETCLIISKIEWAVARMTGHNFSVGKHSSQKRKTFRFSEKFQTTFDPPLIFSKKYCWFLGTHQSLLVLFGTVFLSNISSAFGLFEGWVLHFWDRNFSESSSVLVSEGMLPLFFVYICVFTSRSSVLPHILSLHYLFEQCSNKTYISEHLNINRSVQNSDSVRLCMRPYK